MGCSNHLENLILDNIFGKIWYCPPSLWLGLSKSDPLDNGAGLDEPWLVQSGGTPPEEDGWLWLKGGSWHYYPSGSAAWASNAGSWYWLKSASEEPAPSEQGGFPELSRESGLQVLTKSSGYKRLWLGPGAWYYAIQGVVANAIDLPFPAALLAWGGITHWALFDAWSMTMYGELSPHKTINEGQTPRFNAQQLEIFLS